MEPPTASLPPEPSPMPPDPRQRWRVTYARQAPTGSADLGREYAATWEAGLLGSGLPLVVGESGRPRVSFAAPLPIGIAGRAELLDVWLVERLPAWRVREALEPVLPDGHEVVAVEDTWLGAPPLPGRVVGAEYVVTLGDVAADDVARAAAGLLAAAALPRERLKGGIVRPYDLRPLVADIAVEDPGPPPLVRLRTVIHPELGTGRPDEVFAALGGLVGAPIEVAGIVRQRLVLADDPN